MSKAAFVHTARHLELDPQKENGTENKRKLQI